MRRVLCLNGPNLDRLGERDPSIYGDWSLPRLEQAVEDWGVELGLEVTCHQSNDAGDLIDTVGGSDADGIIINPGGLTHSSPALADAVEAVTASTVEVHISNVRARHRWRRRSYVSGPAIATIAGRGVEGYRSALRLLTHRAAWPTESRSYGPHPDQYFDLRRVDDARTGVVLVHGGFWMDSWGTDTVEGWAVDLARRGLPSAVLEYRRNGSGGGAVATTRDMVDGIPAAVAALSTPNWALLGHSAGGHLAVWAAAVLDPPPPLTISVSGILDLAAADEAGVGGGAVRAFDPDYSTSPAQRKPPSSPVALVHGTDDSIVPAAQSESFVRHAQHRGGNVTLELVSGGHFDSLSADSAVWEAARSQIDSV